ncbi:hypothetical protein MGN70_004966 [Eutypa lata]|uniref:Uncharacterized protein n=1 Tax=Eutypa lata (strain UCR-EL1) TaxID=1287681 RepID=M7TW18_EUTLA|nr:hypothetical protein UCREL1_2108 [Eutypa lata UCREL1]KAI1252761.1 hypothetical protein MGN70_004966 [Eutypa lata]
MADLRLQITTYYHLESRPQADIYAAMNNLRELAELMEQEELPSLELSNVYLEQSSLFHKLGDQRGRRLKHRQALQMRLLCLGANHPSCVSLASEGLTISQDDPVVLRAGH